MTATIHDATRCELGEGPLWHPVRGQLFWFDILGKRLLSVEGGATLILDLPEMTSAAGWVDENTLLTVSETGFDRLDLVTGARDRLAPLEADNPMTRSNDGRADPYGGFWIGTMGKKAEPGAGAFYRYYKGEVRQLWSGASIPNAICFSPDGLFAYFTGLTRRIVNRVALDGEGWPSNEPEVFLDLTGADFSPDGAVTDAKGHFWNARWGAGAVAEYDPTGRLLRTVAIPGAHSSCPAFGGPDLTTLYCTTAMEGIAPDRLKAEPGHGQTFAVEGIAKGRPEPQVLL